jgi:hypothetical protein
VIVARASSTFNLQILHANPSHDGESNNSYGETSIAVPLATIDRPRVVVRGSLLLCYKNQLRSLQCCGSSEESCALAGRLAHRLIHTSVSASGTEILLYADVQGLNVPCKPSSSDRNCSFSTEASLMQLLLDSDMDTSQVMADLDTIFENERLDSLLHNSQNAPLEHRSGSSLGLAVLDALDTSPPIDTDLQQTMIDG